VYIMKNYSVSLYINVQSICEEEAACEAIKLQLLPDAKARSFHVSDDKAEVTTVKLMPN